MSNIGPPYQTAPNAWACGTTANGVFTNVDGVLAVITLQANPGVYRVTLDAKMALNTNSYELVVVPGAASTTGGPVGWFLTDTSAVLKDITFRDMANALANVATLLVAFRLLQRN
jgi:hypothetical protein